jgi:DNA repair protein RecO (recombination protein O)
MQVKTKAIVISHQIPREKLDCKITLSHGLKSYFVRNALVKSNQKIAYFQPLTILEIEAVHKNKGTLEHFKEIKISSPFQTIHSDIYKKYNRCSYPRSCIILSMRKKKTKHFFFFRNCSFWLDAHDEIANFHLILLLEVSKYLGFMIFLILICRFLKWPKVFYTI